MSFEYPIILAIVALALPIILLLMIDGQRRLQKQLSIFISPRLLGTLTHSFSRRLVWIRNCLLLFALILLGLGAARPQWGSEMREIEGRGIDIIFALDASNSMLAEDIVPSRIERSKLAIRDFIREMAGDRVGIIAFAGDAFLQCPLTFDMNAFRMTLKSIRPGIIPHRGTDIAAAIDEARSAFPEGDNAKILILMTDGEDLEESGIEAAKDAAEEGITVYAIGVGASTGSRIPITDRFGERSFLLNADGTPVITRLDESTLTQIASATGGLYVPLGASGNGLERLYQERLSELPDQLRESTVEEIAYERYAYFVIPGFVCLTALFFVGNRRIKPSSSASVVIAACLFGISMSPLDLNAVRPSYQGFKAIEAADWVSAVDLLAEIPSDHQEAEYIAYNLGVARYYLNDFSAAITAFQTALSTSDLDLQSDAFYNLGLAQVSRAMGVDASQFDLESINTQLQDSFQAAYESLKFGEKALAEIPLRRKAWTQNETVLKNLRMLDDGIVETSTPARNRRSILLDAEKSWLNASELNPEKDDISQNLEALQSLLDASEEAWSALARHEEMLPQVENALNEMIRALKRPTSAVLEAEALADKMVAANEYFNAVELLESIAANDPTAEVYRKKQSRLREIVDILAPPVDPLQPQAPHSEFGNP